MYYLEKPNNGLSTYMDGYFYVLKESIYYPMGPRSTRASEPIISHYLFRPEFKYENENPSQGSGSRGSGVGGTIMSGDILRMLRTENAIVVNTSKMAYLHDKRFHKPCYMQALDASSRIVTISDNFIGLNLDDQFLIYRRDAITERTLIHRAGRCTDYADHTMRSSPIAITMESMCGISITTPLRRWRISRDLGRRFRGCSSSSATCISCATIPFINTSHSLWKQSASS